MYLFLASWEKGLSDEDGYSMTGDWQCRISRDCASDVQTKPELPSSLGCE